MDGDRLSKKNNDTFIAIIFIVLWVIVFICFFLWFSLKKSEAHTNTFDEICGGLETDDGTFYSCEDIKKAGLEDAYINKRNIVVYSGKLYEKGTPEEINAGKESGYYCIDASDTWRHIGETRCVVFYPEYLSKSGNNFFIDEKKNYKDGFVVYMYGNYNWYDFANTYDNNILVCGKITEYQGHPQIKAQPNNIIVNPHASVGKSSTYYNYRCGH